MKNQRKLLDLEGKDLEEAINNMISENTNPHMWDAKETEILTRLYKKIPTKILAEQLGRTYSAVGAKAIKLGLTKPYKRNDNHKS